MPALPRNRRAVLGIVAAAVVAYGAALAGTFVYDDFHSVRDNEAIRSLANLFRFCWDLDAFSSSEARMYRPLLLATFALDHALGGGAALAFKLTDLALHAFAAVLVWSLARALRGGFAPALGAGLLFAVHPLAAEAVNYVSSRSDQLLAVGALLAMRLHVDAMRGGRRAPMLVAVATGIACGAKETGVLIPGLLVVLEFLRARRRGVDLGGALRRLLPSIGVALGYLLLRRLLFGVATVAAAPRLAGVTDLASGAGRDLLSQWTAMGTVLPRFVAQAAIPLGLSADPQVPYELGPTHPLVLGGWAALAVLSLAGCAGPRRRPGLFAGTCAAWLLALPWVLIPLNSPANEHRFYGSLAMILVAVGAGLPAALLRARVARGLAVLLCASFAVLAAERSLLFRDPRFVWADALAADPASPAALRGLAQAHQDDAKAAFLAGDERRARTELVAAQRLAFRALARAPRNRTVQEGLIRYELALGPELGRPLVAVVLAEELVARRPTDPFSRIRLSRALAAAAAATGERRFAVEADAAALSVLEIADEKGLVHRVAAEAWRAIGDHEAALRRIDEGMARGFDHWTVRLDRAEILRQLGRPAEAVAEARQVLAVEPFQPRALALIDALRAVAGPPR
jgi:tetratricopeptide (TPR) repeat protein